MIRVAMWSGPRNLSTALLRSFENRADTSVLDEPLYAHYLAATGLDHPMRAEILASQPVEAASAIAACLAQPSEGTAVSYQKHMSHHLLPSMDRGWLDECRHALLIRHPARVLASYLDKRGTATLQDLGLPQQLELVERSVMVIDADRFLAAPRAHLLELCARLGIDFDEAMLSWPAGPRAGDGVWAPHWYDSVLASTGFAPVDRRPLPLVGTEQRDLLADAEAIYADLLERAYEPSPD